jgi:glycosyltransferase involved in cell wall biosynthesis
VPILDLARFEAVAERTREPRVLFVGRLEAEKNLPLWLAVARRVADRVPDARFDIVGGGRLASSVAEMAGRLDLADRVVLHGAKNRDELQEFFGRAAVLLLTSDHEGFGRVLVEAMAAGTAVVSTRTSGAREVIGDSGAGLLAATGDESGLADHVAALLGDPVFAAGVAKLGRERVRGRYDPLRLADAWVDMLIAAADGHRGPMPEPDETPCRES